MPFEAGCPAGSRWCWHKRRQVEGGWNGGGSGHLRPGRLTFMEAAVWLFPPPFSQRPCLVSVRPDIFGFHSDGKTLQQWFYTWAQLKQNLGSCGRLACEPTLAQFSQMLLRT